MANFSKDSSGNETLNLVNTEPKLYLSLHYVRTTVTQTHKVILINTEVHLFIELHLAIILLTFT